MVLPTFVELAKQNKDIIVYGDGKQFRTFCDIRDAVHMLDAISDELHVSETYNIGNCDNVMTITELANTVVSVVGSSSSIIYKKHNEDFSSNFGEIYKRKPNTDKIYKFYKPKHDVKSIINNMI
jgi:nucleoside-diphosphate-sugar epimerase